MAARAPQTAIKIDLMLQFILQTAVANLPDEACRTVLGEPNEQIYGAIAFEIIHGEGELGRFTSTAAP
jgi:hypothetical protein